MVTGASAENKLIRWLRFPKECTFRDHLIGAFLATIFVLWLLSTSKNLGFARDEGMYFSAANSYAQWLKKYIEGAAGISDKASIDAYWHVNHEHPSLMKSLFALSHIYLFEKHKLFAHASDAYRFPAMVMSGIALWVTYLFGVRAYSRRVGLMAALMLMLMPRVFYHAHLACFDLPVVAMWVWCMYVYWRSMQEKSLLWSIFAGVMYGLALETKHNAWIMPAVLVSHAFFVQRHSMWSGLKQGRLSIPTSLITMAIIGPILFYSLWPWLWNDTIPRLQEYVKFHLEHEYYNMEFLGKNYFSPPSPKLYAPVMIAATVPGITLFLFIIGAFDRARFALARVREFVRSHRSRNGLSVSFSSEHQAEQERQVKLAEPDLLFALCFGASLGPFFLPKTPIFGGTKHWMPSYPFLALFAAWGFERAATAFTQVLKPKLEKFHWPAQVVLFVSVIVGPYLFTKHSHPVGLSSYVPLVGGAAGAASLGLNRQFWGFTTQNVADYLRANTRPGSRIFIHDTHGDAWWRMVDEKRVPSGLHAVGAPGDADIVIIHHELHMAEFEHQTWVAFKTVKPDYVLTHDGVPIVTIYKKP